MTIRRLGMVLTILSWSAGALLATSHPKHQFERSLSLSGFRGKVMLRQAPNDNVIVTIRAGRSVSTDTVKGHALFPVLVNGRKQPFFAGRFGASKFPMLIFAVSNPEMIQDSRIIAYQLSPSGGMIGQQVIVDQSIQHGHTDDLTGGRYQLAALDPALGAIYSVAFQDARFEGFFVSYEKLRIRQWDPTINAFIETDQGFLRERSGKLIESSRFHMLSDQRKEEVFLANLAPEPKTRPIQRRTMPRVIPASAVR